MKEKRKKVLAALDTLDLILSIVGFVTCCMVFILARVNERALFYIVAIILGMNIISNIKKIEIKMKKPVIVKYSKKPIAAKSLKKVSY